MSSPVNPDWPALLQASHDRLERSYESLASVIHELGEANSEIRRHHADFTRIRLVLDSADSSVTTGDLLRAHLDNIRNIVG